MPTEPDWPTFARFACHLADQAAKVILPQFRKPIAIEDKQGMADFDPVTAADRDGEAVMRRLIAEHFPDHGIEGEEFGTERGEAELVWVLDPIDGTRGFIAGLPSWTTLVALRYRGTPVIGLIAQPYLKEQFLGTPQGSYLGTRRLQVRACADLSQAVGSSTGTSWFSDHQKARFAGFETAARMVRMGFDAYAYAMLAMGFIDVVAEAGLKPHDIAALIPVVERAGGGLSDWSGGTDFRAGEVLASGDARVHAQAIEALAGGRVDDAYQSARSSAPGR
ncbi:MAG: inositol monophosphatase family protein [Rhodothalassiaceae bacterium]